MVREGGPKFETWDPYLASRRQEWFDRIETVLAPLLFVLACALILIGSWTAGNWIFPSDG